MIIREYKPEDREVIEKCVFELEELEAPMEPTLRQSSKEATRFYYDYLLKRLKEKQGTIFVAEEDGQVIGMVSVIVEEEESPYAKVKDWGYIPDLVVLESHRNKGVGELLLEAAEKFIKERGFKGISLDVMIKNNRAVDFYRRHGYREYNVGLVKELHE